MSASSTQLSSLRPCIASEDSGTPKDGQERWGSWGLGTMLSSHFKERPRGSGSSSSPWGAAQLWFKGRGGLQVLSGGRPCLRIVCPILPMQHNSF